MATRAEKMKAEGLAAWKKRELEKKRIREDFEPLCEEDFPTLVKGDVILRQLGGFIPMELIITEVTDDRVICGSWEFDRNTGIEIDDMISVQVSHISHRKFQYVK
jgi:hypothetical protein